MDELSRALPGDAARDKDQKDADGKTYQKAKLRKKVKIDGLDYDVTFRFDSAARLDNIRFFCNKVKKETFSTIVIAFTELLGEPKPKERTDFPSGDVFERVSWEKADTVFSVSQGIKQLTAFMTGRYVIVTITYVQRDKSDK